MISAEIILDSISPEGHRLTTFKLRYPKFIHQDFQTHRRESLSANSSSSRAIPTQRLIDEAASPTGRARPIRWGKNQSGMRDAGEVDRETQEVLEMWWDTAAINAVDIATRMMRLKAHKQTINRILDPFVHINTVCTGTEYMNFFGLRRHSDTDPTLQAVAELMWKRYETSKPTPLQPGEWHLPFVDKEEIEAFNLLWATDHHIPADSVSYAGHAVRVSVARCARVSYESNLTGKRSTVEEDLALYDRLVVSQPLHASPAEHQATPDTRYRHWPNDWENFYQHGNLTGWRQYRKMLKGEDLATV